MNRGILWTALLALLLGLASSCGGMEEDTSVTDEATTDEAGDIETAEQALVRYTCPSGYYKVAPCGSSWPCYKCVSRYTKYYSYTPTCKNVGGSYSYLPNSYGVCTIGITGFSHTTSCSAFYTGTTWKWYCCRSNGTCYVTSF